MTLPILLIFFVSKWKNNKKHWKIGIWRHCDVIIGRGKSKLGVGLLCTEMIIVCKFHGPSIIGSRDTEGGSEEPPPPVTDWPKKPSLNRVKAALTSFKYCFFMIDVIIIPMAMGKNTSARTPTTYAVVLVSLRSMAAFIVLAELV